uniref:Uncharacterized protein n=1 Tax=Arundo donax TaxID=35708 RepID=A0A0A9ARI6_ARUDO
MAVMELFYNQHKQHLKPPKLRPRGTHPKVCQCAANFRLSTN